MLYCSYAQSNTDLQSKADAEKTRIKSKYVVPLDNDISMTYTRYRAAISAIGSKFTA